MDIVQNLNNQDAKLTDYLSMTIGSKMGDKDSFSNNNNNFIDNNANFTTMNSIYITKLSEQTQDKARIIGTAKHTERA